MGGLHSGRTRKHTCIDDCIVVDLAHLKKNKLLSPGDYHLQSGHWTMTDFYKRKEQTYKFEMRVTEKQIILLYQTAILETDQTHNHGYAVPLTSTPCHYGGARLWFIAPCCNARVRVLYINPKQGDMARMIPQCRQCLDLHYASQMSSYIERHKTYERYLLANYGYTWAAIRYNYELKEHYLKVTPELLEIKLRSQLNRQMEILRLLMRLNRMFLRDHRRALNSLRSEEDQRLYTAHILQEWGPSHMAEALEGLKPDVRIVAEQEVVNWLTAGKKSETPLDLAKMIEMKNQMEEDLQMLQSFQAA